MNDTILNAVSGIKTHQFGLDSVSNNIANVNTAGFKANAPEFKTLFSRSMDSMNSGSVTNNDFSYGVTAGSNNVVTKLGNLKKSDSDTSVAYTGKGWLVVGKNREGSFNVNDDGYDMDGGENFFTKNGDFTLDADGYVVNSEGYYLYGVNLGKVDGHNFTASQDPDKDHKDLAKGEMKPISIPPLMEYGAVETTKVDISVNLNRTREFTNVVKAYTDNDVFNESGLFNQDFNALANNDSDMIDPKSYSNVDIEVTMPDGTRKIAHYEYGDGTSSQGRFRTLGQLQYLIKRDTGLSFELNRNSQGEIDPRGMMVLKNPTDEDMKVKVTGRLMDRLKLSNADETLVRGGDFIDGTNLGVPSLHTNTEVFDASGRKYLLRTAYYLSNSGDSRSPKKIPEIWNVKSAVYEIGDDSRLVSKETSEGVLLFDSDGKAIADDIKVSFLEKEMDLILSRSTNRVYSHPGVNDTKQDGKSRGVAQNVRINDNGIISVAFSNGEQEAIGRVGLVSFANDQGLKKVGGNLFQLDPRTIDGEQRLVSGNPKLSWGDDANLKNGKVMQGFVETSNVDVGNALTNLILMQRGYSMNAKAFTTGDDLVKEAINLKRS